MTATPPPARHLCVGPSCWTCGEPDEIRQLRQYEVLSALYQLAQDHPGADHHRQARAAMDALRPTLMRWLHAEADLRETRQQLDARDAENERLRAEIRAQGDVLLRVRAAHTAARNAAVTEGAELIQQNQAACVAEEFARFAAIDRDTVLQSDAAERAAAILLAARTPTS